MMIDDQMMMHAFDLSQKARLNAPPNPWVGCVIIKDGIIVGEGYSGIPGTAHAEIVALEKAGQNAEGATAYITLEPCCHHGRTPPCTAALIKAKIARAVIGIQDPDTRVCGKGIAELRQAGIDVTLGNASEAITDSLAPYLYHRTTGRPYCLAKAAVSIDGRVAARDGTSQWISGDEARKNVHQMRAESQAILVGAGTAITDKPALTVRDVPVMPAKPLLRVVLDAKGKVLPPGALFDTKQAPTLIFTTDVCPEQVKEIWKQHGVEVVVVPKAADGRGVDLDAVLEVLGSKDILQLYIEGGSIILSSFLEARLIKQLSIFVGPRILGAGGYPLFRNDFVNTIADAPKLTLKYTKAFGSTVRLDYVF